MFASTVSLPRDRVSEVTFGLLFSMIKEREPLDYSYIYISFLLSSDASMLQYFTQASTDMCMRPCVRLSPPVITSSRHMGRSLPPATAPALLVLSLLLALKLNAPPAASTRQRHLSNLRI